MQKPLKSFALSTLVGLGLLGSIVTQATAGPVEYVKVCQSYGAQFIYIPGTETCLNVSTGETVRATVDGPVYGETTLKQQADAAEAGAAVAIALPNATVDEGKTFGLAANYGVYGDSSALGISGAFKPADGLTLNAGAGFSTAGGPAGGRVGVNFSW